MITDSEGTNGDPRLEPTPGQWEPVPKVGKRPVGRARNEISVRMQYPDPEKNRRGFNPIVYPNLELGYTLKVKPDGEAFKIVDEHPAHSVFELLTNATRLPSGDHEGTLIVPRPP